VFTETDPRRSEVRNPEIQEGEEGDTSKVEFLEPGLLNMIRYVLSDLRKTRLML
jgi:hypothetical protein